MEKSIEEQILDRLSKLEQDIAFIRGEISGRNHRLSWSFTRISTYVSHAISLVAVVVGVVLLIYRVWK